MLGNSYSYLREHIIYLSFIFFLQFCSQRNINLLEQWFGLKQLVTNSKINTGLVLLVVFDLLIVPI